MGVNIKERHFLLLTSCYLGANIRSIDKNVAVPNHIPFTHWLTDFHSCCLFLKKKLAASFNQNGGSHWSDPPKKETK